MSQPDPSSGTSVQGSSAPQDVERRALRVVLEIVPGGPCFIDEFEGDIVDVDVRLGGGRCHCDVSLRASGDTSHVVRKYRSKPICDHCPGAVMSQYSCLPRYKRVGDGWFILETCVSDIPTVSEIVGESKRLSDRVTVRSLVPIEPSALPDICDVDMTRLTTKQRQAVHAAIETGYYDPDSSTSLDQVAARLSLSSAALSQRLKRAEANIMRQLSEGCVGSETGSCVCPVPE